MVSTQPQDKQYQCSHDTGKPQGYMGNVLFFFFGARIPHQRGCGHRRSTKDRKGHVKNAGTDPEGGQFVHGSRTIALSDKGGIDHGQEWVSKETHQCRKGDGQILFRPIIVVVAFGQRY